MSAVSWAAVFSIIFFGVVSNVGVSRFNAACNFIGDALADGIAPEVVAAFFSVNAIAVSVSIISSTCAFAGFVTIVAAVAFVSALVVDIAPDFVLVVAVFTTVLFARVSVDAVWCVSRAALVRVVEALVVVWAVG